MAKPHCICAVCNIPCSPTDYVLDCQDNDGTETIYTACCLEHFEHLVQLWCRIEDYPQPLE